MVESIDAICVLEDEKSYARIAKVMLDGVPSTVVQSLQGFESYFRSGNLARVYLLDDRVPETDGTDTLQSRFLENYGTLERAHADRGMGTFRVIYIGDNASPEVIDFCRAREIEMILGKPDFYTVLQKEIDLYKQTLTIPDLQSPSAPVAQP